jgi:hypothetical protein
MTIGAQNENILSALFMKGPPYPYLKERGKAAQRGSSYI